MDTGRRDRGRQRTRPPFGILAGKRDDAFPSVRRFDAASIFRRPGDRHFLPHLVHCPEIQMTKMISYRRPPQDQPGADGRLRHARRCGAHAEGAHTRHVHAAIQGGEAQMVGNPPASQVMNLDIVLPVRDRDGLKALAAAVTDPDSPMFRHYLTPAQFTERFGPTQADYDTVRSYMEERGLKVDRRHARRHGTAGAAASIDKVEQRVPRDDAQLQAPDREPHVLLAGPRADHRHGRQAVARLGHGQLLHPARRSTSSAATTPRPTASPTKPS